MFMLFILFSYFMPFVYIESLSFLCLTIHFIVSLSRIGVLFTKVSWKKKRENIQDRDDFYDILLTIISRMYEHFHF